MNDDRQAFQAAMDSAPDDRAPHLVLADWLDEHDQPEEAAYHRRWTVEVRDAENWLKDFCDKSDCPDYETVMASIKTGKLPRQEEDDDGGYYRFEWDSAYLHFGGLDAHGPIPPEFWDHVQTALGIEVGENKRPTSFSCSC